jgi:hypothetical protein
LRVWGSKSAKSVEAMRLSRFSNNGRLETKLMMPPGVVCPYNTELGPLITSTRSSVLMSYNRPPGANPFQRGVDPKARSR